MESSPLSPAEHSDLISALFRGLPPDDKARWFDQGFRFNEEATVRFGLRQRSGGPCGVLAAIQGYVLYVLLFGADISRAREVYGQRGPAAAAAALAAGAAASPADAEARMRPSDAQQQAALAHALAWAIWQASISGEESGHPVRPLRIVTPTAAGDALHPDSPAASYTVHTLPAATTTLGALSSFIVSHSGAFGSPAGVLLLVLSVLLSRGLDVVAADMDETTPLVARFGHCTQVRPEGGGDRVFS
jgi:ubiquitin carboxyl-terminal hydrolase MINDY-3/4